MKATMLKGAMLKGTVSKGAMSERTMLEGTMLEGTMNVTLSRSFRLAQIATAAILFFAAGVNVADAGASDPARCGAGKLGASAKHAKGFGRCLERVAKGESPSELAACLADAGTDVAASFADIEGNLAQRGYLCHGTPGELGLIGSGLEDYIAGTLFDGAALPDRCVRAKVKAIAKLKAKELGCLRKNESSPDALKLTRCSAKAALKFDSSWAKADSKGACGTDDAATARAAVVASCAEILETLRFGEGFFDSPVDGITTTDETIAIDGAIHGTAEILTVAVNGILQALAPDGSFSVDVPLDPQAIFNPILVEIVTTLGEIRSERITVVAGDGVNTDFTADGDLSEDGLSIHLSDLGLSDLGPLLAVLAGDSLDIGALLLGNGPLVVEHCLVEPFPNFCILWLTVEITDFGFSDFSIDVEPTPGEANLSIALEGVYVELEANITDKLALDVDCGVTVDSDSASIDAGMSILPLLLDPSNLDVNQLADVDVAFSGFDFEFTSGVCSYDGLDVIFTALVGDIESLVHDGFVSSLGDPDGIGSLDGVLASALEDVFGDLNPSGPIGDLLDIIQDNEYFDVDLGAGGITLDLDSAFGLDSVLPEFPDLGASLEFLTALPDFGSVTPQGSLPFDMGVGISPSALNQLLKAGTELGALTQTITEIDGTPLDVAWLKALLPSLDLDLPDAQAIEILVHSAVAPVVTAAAQGPGGELAELLLGGLAIDVVLPGSGAELLSLVGDCNLGLDLAFVDGLVDFDLADLDLAGLDLTVLHALAEADPAQLEVLFQIVLGQLTGELEAALGEFPIPSFDGLDATGVEIARLDDVIALFLDLAPNLGN